MIVLVTNPTGNTPMQVKGNPNTGALYVEDKSLRGYKGFALPVDGVTISPPADALIVMQAGAISFQTVGPDGSTPVTFTPTLDGPTTISGPITKVTAVGGGVALASMQLAYFND